MSEIRTERLVLSRPSEFDLADIAGLLADFSVARMLATVPHPHSLEHARAWLERVHRPDADHRRIFAIGLDGRTVGSIGFRNRAGDPAIGYWLGKPYWGRGLMSEAARAAVGWFFPNMMRQYFMPALLRIIRHRRVFRKSLVSR